MTALIIIATVLILLAFVAAAAHVLELPGKLRLDATAYRHVQTIYYPGFTIAGLAEPLGVIACLATAVLLPAGSSRMLIVAAGGCLVAAHLVYWIAIHPVNGFWLAGEKLGRAGKTFFGSPSRQPRSWTALRNRWEFSHLIRAVFAGAALALAQFAFLDHAR